MKIETKCGSIAEQLEELGIAQKLVKSGKVRAMEIVCVMRDGSLVSLMSFVPEDWLCLRGGLLTAALGTGGGDIKDGIPDVSEDEPEPEPEPETEPAEVLQLCDHEMRSKD